MGGINPADDAELEQRLGYNFTRPELLDQALTHSSAVPELRASLMETPGTLRSLPIMSGWSFSETPFSNCLPVNIC